MLLEMQANLIYGIEYCMYVKCQYCYAFKITQLGMPCSTELYW